jgi:hypothetical protein
MIVDLFLSLLMAVSGLTSQPQRKYSCALTNEEYLQLPEVQIKIQKTDEERTHNIDPSFASKYASLKTAKEKTEYIDYLINHKFFAIDVRKPENAAVLEFLKSLDFSITSAKDVDRCYPATVDMKKQYQDTLHFYYSPIAKTGCSFFIYGVRDVQEIDGIGCSLKRIAAEHKTGTLYVTFYEKEVFERSVVDSTSAIAARGDEKIIEKLVILQ